MIRSLIRFFALLVPIMILVSALAIGLLDRLQASWVRKDLERRASLIFSSLEDALEQSLQSGDLAGTRQLLDKVSRDELLMGVLICPAPGSSVARVHNESLPPTLTCGRARAEKHAVFLYDSRTPLYVGHFQLSTADVYIFNDATLWLERNEATRWYAFLFLLLVSVINVIASSFMARWTISRPLRDLGIILRDVVGLGNSRARFQRLQKTEFAPLIRDLLHMTKEVRELRGENGRAEGGLWSAKRLREYVQRVLSESPLCVIANREPYIHNRKEDGTLLIQRPASGLVTGVEPILKACNGTWIAHGSGSADRDTVDANSCVAVPPDSPEYTVRRIWLTPEEERGYYYGFSNEGLWPLCHIAHQRPRFDSNDWEHYRAVNRKFAQGFVQQFEGRPAVVLIQDYHFSLLPRLIREESPDSVILLFWHIPWPNPEAFGICPWRNEIIEAMLAADVLGFHTQFHCNNFLDSVDRYVESRIDRERFDVGFQGHECRVRPFPISIPWRDGASRAQPPIREQLGLPPDTVLGVGVDRVDYTKGLPERLLGVSRFAERRPDLARRFAFVQIGAPSRTSIPVYRALNESLKETVEQINARWRPEIGRDLIHLRLFHHNPEEIVPFYEQSDICVVTPLHDGMNLVAKEFIAARERENGVLVLSQFAGASSELREALIVNPYGPDDIATKLVHACEMTSEEQRDRMRRLRTRVKEDNVYKWAYLQLRELHDVRQIRRLEQD